MTSIFRAAVVVGLLSLCNVGTVLAATPVVSESKPAASTEQDTPRKNRRLLKKPRRPKRKPPR